MRLLLLTLSFFPLLSVDLLAQTVEPIGPQEIYPEFQPGNTYRFVTTTEVMMQLPGQGKKEMVVEHQARLDVGVRKDGRKGVAIKARTERLDVDLRSGARELKYNSLEKKDRETTLGKHFESSLNRWLDLQLDSKMRIVSAEEGGRAGVATPLPGLPQFGPDELRKLVASIPQGFPEDPVEVGDEWVLKGDRSVGEAGAMAFEVTYRFMGYNSFEGNNCAVIEFDGRLTGDLALTTDSESVLSQGRMDFQGTSLVGRILFDPLDKTVRFSEQAISMTLDVPAGSGEQPARVPMQQKSTLRLLQVAATQ